MKKVSCASFCKKPKALRNSKYCEEWCRIFDNEIVFSCDKNLESKELEDDKNLLNCIFNDIGHYEACNKCMLSCKNNNNPNIKKIKEEERKLNAIINDLKKTSLPVNINPEKLQDISKSFSENKKSLENTREAIEAVNIARNILEGLSEGRTPDPSSFAIVAHHFKRKFRKK